MLFCFYNLEQKSVESSLLFGIHTKQIQCVPIGVESVNRFMKNENSKSARLHNHMRKRKLTNNKLQEQ